MAQKTATDDATTDSNELTGIAQGLAIGGFRDCAFEQLDERRAIVHLPGDMRLEVLEIALRGLRDCVEVEHVDATTLFVRHPCHGEHAGGA